MNVAVVTIASGRHDHLVRQHEALCSASISPSHYVVVAMNDPELAEWEPEGSLRADIIQIDSVPGTLPLAAARNAGAEFAIAHGAELLVFLDVDCLPTSLLLAGYSDAAAHHPDAILSGAVGYLPEGTDYSSGDLSSSAYFHGFRPRLPDGVVSAADPRLFWSLSFAVPVPAWERIGGFHEGYRGYGAEDTDFAQLAGNVGVELLWVGGAEAFHQYHQTETPPVQHLDDILRNGALFADRWGFWPMQGWLDEFEDLGLVRWDDAARTWQLNESVG